MSPDDVEYALASLADPVTRPVALTLAGEADLYFVRPAPIWLQCWCCGDWSTRGQPEWTRPRPWPHPAPRLHREDVARRRWVPRARVPGSRPRDARGAPAAVPSSCSRCGRPSHTYRLRTALASSSVGCSRVRAGPCRCSTSCRIREDHREPIHPERSHASTLGSAAA